MGRPIAAHMVKRRPTPHARGRTSRRWSGAFALIGAASLGHGRPARAELAGAAQVAGGVDLSTAQLLRDDPKDAPGVVLQPHAQARFPMVGRRGALRGLDATLGVVASLRSTDGVARSAPMSTPRWYQADLVSGLTARFAHDVSVWTRFAIRAAAISDLSLEHEATAAVSWLGGGRGAFTGLAPSLVLVREDHATRRGSATGGYVGVGIAPGVVARVPSATVSAAVLAEVGVASGAYLDDPLRGDRPGCLAAGARLGLTLDRVPRRLGLWTFTVQTRAYQRGALMTTAGGDGDVVVATTVGLGVVM